MEPNFWSDQDSAKHVLKKLSGLEQTVKKLEQLKLECEELLELSRILDPEKDVPEAAEMTERVAMLQKQVEKLELETSDPPFVRLKFISNVSPTHKPPSSH